MRRTVITPRKKPVQERSAQLVADILNAAIRVLEREGPLRFTTIRVAETAGVSVGSLYQYFPNKQAILYRLQVEEWGRTESMMEGILTDRRKSPAKRLQAMMRAFFLSEQDEAPLRTALDVAAPNWEDAPDAKPNRERHEKVVRAFIAEAAPRATPKQRKFAGELLKMTAGAIGKRLSEQKRSEQRSKIEIGHWADEITAMLMLYLEALPRTSRAGSAVAGA